jgi:site-specific DNA recombinase
VVLTKSISRFGRDTVETLSALRRLNATGTRVIFDEENLDTNDVDSEMKISVMESFAQAENEFRAVQEETKKRSNIIADDEGTHRIDKKYSSKKDK